MAGSKILIVEDDSNLLTTLEYNLRKEGYSVVTAADGAEAVETARREKPDLIILDVMLPNLSGLEVCRVLRKDITVPIIMLTARTEEVDKIVGLEIGADDYMTKPFSIRELIARIHAMLRRAAMPQADTADRQECLRAGDIEIDTGRRRSSCHGETLNLTPKEYDLLLFLARNRGYVFSREQLLEKVWGYDFGGGTRTVDVHVRWLRQKIEDDPAHPRYLVTVRGVGYKLEG